MPGAVSGAFTIARRKRFELHLGGLERTWSLAKEPSLDPKTKRLAFLAKDGAARPEPSAEERWDQGTWRWVARDGFASPDESLAAGKLHFVLEGERLKGEFGLAETRKGWLLFKAKDEHASRHLMHGGPPPPAPRGPPYDFALDALVPPAERKKLEAAPLPPWIGPMLPSMREEPTHEPGRWLNELKLDGVRVLALKEGAKVRLFSRRGNSLERQFPEVAREIARLPHQTLALDGEICVLDAEGRARFQLIQPRIHVASDALAERLARETPSVCFAFDLLHVDGLDLRRLPLATRKDVLRALLPAEGEALRFLKHVDGQGDDFFALICTKGVEGIVQKRADSAYTSGRSRFWWKIKCGQDLDFVVAGYCLYESTSAGGLGGLLLGLHHEGKLLYVGGCGTGWSDKERRALRKLVAQHERRTTPFAAWSGLGGFWKSKMPEKIVWLDPVLVARCHFAEFTDDGKVRGSSFQRLEDRDPATCLWPTDAPLPVEEGPRSAPGERSPSDARETRLPRLTNPDKVFFPERGHTKGDLFRYYEMIAPVLLPHLRDRPMVLRRLPEGIHGGDFYQKNQGKGAPEWLRTVTLHSKESDRDIKYAVVDDVGALLYCIQLGCISLSPWSSRLGSLEHPDFSIIDLDPGPECTFDQVVAVAQLVHELLDGLGLRGYVKTSGATGIHVLVPLEPRYTYEQSRILAEIVASLCVERRPDLCTVVRAVKPRPKDKVYVDFLQNAMGKHVACAYSVREVEAASVSAPLKWDEVRRGLRPDQFTIGDFEERVRRVGDLWRPVLEDKQALEKAFTARR